MAEKAPQSDKLDSAGSDRSALKNAAQAQIKGEFEAPTTHNTFSLSGDARKEELQPSRMQPSHTGKRNDSSGLLARR